VPVVTGTNAAVVTIALLYVMKLAMSGTPYQEMVRRAVWPPQVADVAWAMPL
jgi:hypothetical protein